MPSFKDKFGREWLVNLDPPTVVDVRNECGLDLASLDGQAFVKLSQDSVLLVDVLWVICREQTDQNAPHAARNFGRGFNGAAIEAASEALMEAVVDFSQPRTAGILRDMLAKYREIEARELAKVGRKIKSGTLEKQAAAAIDQALAQLDQTGEASTPSSNVSPWPDSAELPQTD